MCTLALFLSFPPSFCPSLCSSLAPFLLSFLPFSRSWLQLPLGKGKWSQFSVDFCWFLFLPSSSFLSLFLSPICLPILVLISPSSSLSTPQWNRDDFRFALSLNVACHGNTCHLHGAFFFSLPLATLLPLMIDTKIRMNSSSSPPFPSIRLFLPLHNHLSRMETGQFFMWSRTQVPEDSPSPMSFSITIPSRCSVFPVSHLLSLPWVLLIYLLVYSLWGEIKRANCQALVFPVPLVMLASILYWLTIRWSPYLMLMVLSTENTEKPRHFLLPKFREANK